MKILNKMTKFTALLLIVLMQFVLMPASKAYAATSPTLTDSASYSVLGATTVTNTDSATTTTGDVGVATGTAITGFPPGIAGGDNVVHLHSDDASAIAAQADNLTAFGTLDQGCDYNYPDGQDLTLLSPLVPGVYCSAGSFLLTGNLTLAGSGVWIFKTVSGLTTSSGSSVTGGDPCNVWWRIGSSAVLGTTTSFIGNILALTSISLQTGATLNGRAMVQTGEVTLDDNTISGPVCAVAPTPTPAPTSPSCNSDEHLDLSGTKCLKYELGGPPQSSGGAVTSTGQVLGASTLASTGSGNSKLGVILMLLGAGITLTSLYVLKKNSF